jgi:PAS domain-containing protein
MSSQALPAQAKLLFRYLFEQASLGIAVEDFEGNLLLANPALCSMLGYREDELCGMNCFRFANPEDSQDDRALFQQLRAGVNAAKASRALGLVSMEERPRLVGGQLSINSQPKHGTTTHARVRLNSGGS